jgi:hypothetical protein
MAVDRSIIKASGNREEFSLEKLADSLVRAGASTEVAQQIARKVEAQVTPSWRTKHIYRTAKRLLRQVNHATDMRYSIKRAMFALGPAGYQFEQFFSGILKEYGYETETNRFLDGYCVRHEVDVFAVKDEGGIVIECKYHSDAGNATDVKTALYVQSRVEDIRKANASNGSAVPVKEGWLVTNTRCTSDAVKYAACAGLKIVSWRYPEGGGLEKLIEDRRLYPVTVLSSLKRGGLELLFRNGILFAKDIAGMDETSLVRRSGLDQNIAKALKREADDLYFSG